MNKEIIYHCPKCGYEKKQEVFQLSTEKSNTVTYHKTCVINKRDEERTGSFPWEKYEK